MATLSQSPKNPIELLNPWVSSDVTARNFKDFENLMKQAGILGPEEKLHVSFNSIMIIPFKDLIQALERSGITLKSSVYDVPYTLNPPRDLAIFVKHLMNGALQSAVKHALFCSLNSFPFIDLSNQVLYLNDFGNMCEGAGRSEGISEINMRCCSQSLIDGQIEKLIFQIRNRGFKGLINIGVEINAHHNDVNSYLNLLDHYNKKYESNKGAVTFYISFDGAHIMESLIKTNPGATPANVYEIFSKWLVDKKIYGIEVNPWNTAIGAHCSVRNNQIPYNSMISELKNTQNTSNNPFRVILEPSAESISKEELQNLLLTRS